MIAEFVLEQERAKLPGYVSRYDDVDYDDDAGNITRQLPSAPHYPLKASPEVAGNPADKSRDQQNPEHTRSAPQQASVVPAPHNLPASKTESVKPPLTGSQGFGEGIF